jgi:hypothetical protein
MEILKMASNRTPKDFYEQRSSELDSPARYAFEIDPGAGDLTASTRGIYIGTSGNVFCRMTGHANNTNIDPKFGRPYGTTDANVFFMNTVGGTILPVRVDKIWVRNELDLSQNTTASEIVGLY